ncbi:hypothetical protein QT995_04535 [Microcoleus sp. S36b_A3]|uniref:hypothetical protein n=1 Tax=unclassified Microcoleus TaxID=2642155 RepID=UPI002FD636BD
MTNEGFRSQMQSRQGLIQAISVCWIENSFICLKFLVWIATNSMRILADQYLVSLGGFNSEQPRCQYAKEEERERVIEKLALLNHGMKKKSVENPAAL